MVYLIIGFDPGVDACSTLHELHKIGRSVGWRSIWKEERVCNIAQWCQFRCPDLRSTIRGKRVRCKAEHPLAVSAPL